MASIEETGIITTSASSADASNRNDDDGGHNNDRQNGPTQRRPERGDLDNARTPPNQVISRATLTHVGFTEAKADQVWNDWNRWLSSVPRPMVNPDSDLIQEEFLAYMTLSMGLAVDTACDDDDIWRAVMTAYGLGREIQENILDPTFNHVRLAMGTCCAWAREAVEVRYNRLRRGLLNQNQGAASRGQEGRDEWDW